MSESEEILGPVRQALENGSQGMFQCMDIRDSGTPDGGHLRVETSLLYPGGQPINVHVRTDPSGYVVTDQGITSNILKHLLPNVQNQKPGLGPLIRKICKGLDVEIRGQEWTVNAGTPEDVGRAAMILAQAMLRMSITASMIRIINGGQAGETRDVE